MLPTLQKVRSVAPQRCEEGLQVAIACEATFWCRPLVRATHVSRYKNAKMPQSGDGDEARACTPERDRDAAPLAIYPYDKSTLPIPGTMPWSWQSICEFLVTDVASCAVCYILGGNA